MTNSDKARENAYRRQAIRLGLALRKSRARHWSINDQGGYYILDAATGGVVLGSRRELDLDEVGEFLEKYERELRAKAE